MPCKVYQILFYSLLLTTSCSPGKKELEFKEIGWTIRVPEEFEMMDAASIEKMNQVGNRAIEGEDNGNSNTKTLFCIKTDDFHYLAATITPGTTAYVEGLHSGNKDLKNFMFTTLKSQMQGAEIDTISSPEVINERTFDKFKISINLPYKPTFHINVYSALVKQYELGITVAYVDQDVGNKFTSIIRSSSFK